MTEKKKQCWICNSSLNPYNKIGICEHHNNVPHVIIEGISGNCVLCENDPKSVTELMDLLDGKLLGVFNISFEHYSAHKKAMNGEALDSFDRQNLFEFVDELVNKTVTLAKTKG